MSDKTAGEWAQAEFTDWFVRNYPGPDTIIHDPKWHAPKVFRAARHAMERIYPVAPPPPVVKPLEWERSGHCWRASTPLGIYLITEYAGMRKGFKLEFPQFFTSYFDDLETAQARAWKDYAGIILSALEEAKP